MPTAFDIETTDQIQARLTALKARQSRQHDDMRKLDPWRHCQDEDVEDDVWDGAGENTTRKTEPSRLIAAVTDTVVAFLGGERPQITATAKNTTSQQQSADANQVERIGYRLFDTINHDREVPLLYELAESAVHRGAVIVKVLWLSPEERGAVIEQNEPLIADPLGEQPAETVVDPGDFPLLVEVLDPLDCVWQTGKDGRTIEFIHEYRDTYDVLCDTFPELMDNEEFADRRSPGNADNAQMTVIDYWNEDINAILVDGKFVKEPTEHNYYCLPVVVEQINPRNLRYKDNTTARYGRPFCLSMLEPVKRRSKLTSTIRTYMERTVGAVMTHEGVTDESFQMQTNETTGEAEYVMELDSGSDSVIVPLRPGEKLTYPMPPPLPQHVQIMFQEYDNEVAMTSFNLGILTGQMPAGPSGVSVTQQRLATVARMSPYGLGTDRALSRTLSLGVKHFQTNWDVQDGEIMLVDMLGQSKEQGQQVGVTLDTFDAVGNISAHINVDVPIDKDQQDSMIIQQYSTHLLSQRNAIDKLNRVEDADDEVGRIAAETLMMQDPQTLARFANAWLAKQNIPALQPAPPPPPPSGPGGPAAAPVAAGLPPPAGPPMGMPPMGGPPMGNSPMGMGVPQMPPQGPPLGPQGGPPPQIPPQLLAMMQGQ